MAAMTKVDLDHIAFREGLFVRALGRPRDRNPYPPGSEQSDLWESGWRLIDAEWVGVESARSVPPVKRAPMFEPGIADDNSLWEDAEPLIVRVSRPRCGRLIDAAIILTFAAVLFGMWMLTMSR